MSKSRWMISLAAVTLASSFGISMAQAQEQGQRNRGDRPDRQQRDGQRGERGERGQRGQRGERGADRGDRMAQFRERMAQRMKTTLGVNDEEWAVLAPQIEKISQLQRQTRAGGMGMMGGRRGGPGGPGGQAQGGDQADRAQTPIAKASQELRTALNDEKASADTLKAKLEAYRNARKQTEKELASAQEELRSLLTPKQEAHLVMMGLLD